MFNISSDSDSEISESDKSTTEVSTSGVFRRRTRSNNPFLNFKDDQVSTREQISACVDQMEIRSSEILEPASSSDEDVKHLGMLLPQLGDGSDGNDKLHKMINVMNDARFVRTMSLLGAAGVIALMAFLRS